MSQLAKTGSTGRAHPRRAFLAAGTALALLFGCGNDAEIVPEITSEAKEGSTDLVFQLRRSGRDAAGAQVVSAVGLAQGIEVGFDLELGRWDENPPGYMNMSTWQSRARLRSRGAASDALLRFLDAHYGVRRSPEQMVASIEALAFSPWKDPAGLEEGEVTLHLLIEPGFDERDKAEIRVEIDSDDGRVRLREKDPRWRGALIAALTEPPVEPPTGPE